MKGTLLLFYSPLSGLVFMTVLLLGQLGKDNAFILFKALY